MWLHVVVKDAGGNILFERGNVPVDKDPEETSDPSLTTDCTFPETNPTGCGAFYDRMYKTDGTAAHFFWEVARTDSHLIKPPVTRDANSPLYDHSTTVKFNVGSAGQIDRVDAELLMRPLPLSTLRELEQSGDLDPSIRQQVADPMNTLHVGEKSVWTKATAGTGPAINTPCNPF